MSSLRSRIRRNWRAISAVAALVADAGIVSSSFLLAVAVVHPSMPFVDAVWSHSNLWLFSLVLYPLCYAGLGLYRIISYASLRRHVLTAARAQAYAFAIILSLLFLVQNQFYTAQFLVTFFVLNLATYALAWLSLRRVQHMLRHAGYGRWNTIVFDGKTPMHVLMRRYSKFPELGYSVSSIVRSFPVGSSDDDFKSQTEWLEQLIVSHKADLIALSSSRVDRIYNVMEDLCRKHSARILVYSDDSDDLLRRTKIRDLAGLPIYSPQRRRVEFAKRIVKRSVDIIFSSLLLALLSPLFFLIAVAIKLESKGSVFFKQKRSCCEDAEQFLFYKFRTMVDKADEHKATLFHLNETNGALFKMKDDPRMTHIGRFLRPYSLDELPQLINVFKGEMSLVGPRPLPVEDFARLREQDKLDGYYQLRGRVKPGMTGLWQVSGRSDIGFHEMVLLDLYYVERQTLLFDLELLAQTIPVVVFGKGAY